MTDLNFPKIGNMAPAFTLLNQREEKVSLRSFKGEKNVVVYFYPKAMTPGCTVQACGIRDYKKNSQKRTLLYLLLVLMPQKTFKIRRKR